MTSKIKVDNINKVSDDSNIINKCGANITVGANGDTVIIPNGVTEQIQSGGDIQVQSGGQITIASGATITNNGTAVGLGRTGTVDWVTTPKTGTFTAVNGEGYFVDTDGGTSTANLPAGSAGAIVAFSDYARNFQTNTLTISPNGSEKIGGIAQDLVLNIEGQALTLVYVDGTQGWINVQNAEDTETGTPPFIQATGGTISCSGNCRIHTFTAPGTFQVTSISPTPANNTAAYLIVGSGGGADGGSGSSASGAGAGGFREGRTNPITPYTASPLAAACSGITLSVQSYPIVVGGGAAGTNSNGGAPTNQSPGNVSSALGLSAAGGGSGNPGGSPTAGNPGGSGGGGSGNNPPAAAGSGNDPATSPSQGNDGGNATPSLGPGIRAGGGGGGAGDVGGQGQNPNVAGAGGVGVPTSITGSALSYAGGGGGSNQMPGQGTGGGASPCGTGGSGKVRSGGDADGESGTTNRGGGGGAGVGTSSTGGSGGSGVVVIRYKRQ
jgi:hypothetical protein